MIVCIINNSLLKKSKKMYISRLKISDSYSCTYTIIYHNKCLNNISLFPYNSVHVVLLLNCQDFSSFSFIYFISRQKITSLRGKNKIYILCLHTISMQILCNTFLIKIIVTYCEFLTMYLAWM